MSRIKEAERIFKIMNSFHGGKMFKSNLVDFATILSLPKEVIGKELAKLPSPALEMAATYLLRTNGMTEKSYSIRAYQGGACSPR
jgi:hypothetical protein